MSQQTTGEGAPGERDDRTPGDRGSGEGTELTTTEEPTTFEPEEDPDASAAEEGHPS